MREMFREQKKDMKEISKMLEERISEGKNETSRMLKREIEESRTE